MTEWIFNQVSSMNPSRSSSFFFGFRASGAWAGWVQS